MVFALHIVWGIVYIHIGTNAIKNGYCEEVSHNLNLEHIMVDVLSMLMCICTQLVCTNTYSYTHYYCDLLPTFSISRIHTYIIVIVCRRIHILISSLFSFVFYHIFFLYYTIKNPVILAILCRRRLLIERYYIGSTG